MVFLQTGNGEFVTIQWLSSVHLANESGQYPEISTDLTDMYPATELLPPFVPVEGAPRTPGFAIDSVLARCVRGGDDAPAKGERPDMILVESAGKRHLVVDDGDGGFYDGVMAFLRTTGIAYDKLIS